MKYRCTMVIDLEIPDAKTEYDAAAIFAGVVGLAISTSPLFPQWGMKLIENKAEKVENNGGRL